MKYVIYSNVNELFVTSSEDEESFKKKLVSGGYDLDPDDGDFDREVIDNDHISITKSNRLYVDSPDSYEFKKS